METEEKHRLAKSEKAGNVWYLIGGTALALVIAAVAANFHDIKRYVKISTM